MSGAALSIASGIFASLASGSAKLALSTTDTKAICERASRRFQLALPDGESTVDSTVCHIFVFQMQVAAFLLVIFMNVIMWTLFVKAMRKCRTTVEALLLNTSSNLIFSSLMGYFLFSETLSLMWWIGFSMIVLGVCLLQKGRAQAHDKTD